jgi:CheY-like chemotaxis protein
MIRRGKASPRATVLVVDDDPSMLEYVRTMLELDGYRVETAVGGMAALDKLRCGAAPDLVLLDMQMPGMDGLETLRQLLRFRSGLKVIMCSGVSDPRKALAAFLLGAQDYLTKPFRHLYLSAALERCLHAPAGRGSVPWNVVRDMWEVAT